MKHTRSEGNGTSKVMIFCFYFFKSSHRTKSATCNTILVGEHDLFTTMSRETSRERQKSTHRLRLKKLKYIKTFLKGIVSEKNINLNVPKNQLFFRTKTSKNQRGPSF